ncbi:MAG: cupin domain-containing protein [Pseudonocardiaceae bacterium]
MIVTTREETSHTLRAGTEHSRTRSLARRGFFFSETEAVDYLRLAPGSEIGPRGRSGTEEVWFVLDGDGHLTEDDGTTRPLRRNCLAVCALNSGTRLKAGAQGMELVLVAVVPRHLTDSMPTRLPVAS